MMSLWGKVCNHVSKSEWDDRPLATDLVPGEYAVAKARDGKTIIFDARGARDATIVLPSLKSTRITCTFVDAHRDPMAPPLAQPTQRFAIVSRDDPCCYLPDSHSPFLDILRRRARDEPALAAALEDAPPPADALGMDELNRWLCDAGLYALRLVAVDAARRLGAPLRRQTLVDVMNVCYVGTYAIWVKDPEAYVRPETDVLAHDARAAAQPAAWAQPHLHTPSGSSVVAWFCYRHCSDGRLRLNSVVTSTGQIFRGASTHMVVRELLMWLSTCREHMTVYGFYSSFFDAEQVFALAGRGWTRVGANTIISKLGNRVTFVDLARFAPGTLFSEYCEFWGGACVDVPEDILQADENAALAEDAAAVATHALADAAAAHQAALARIFPSCDMAAFRGLCDMVLGNAARGCGACPMHASALDLVGAALFLEEAGENPIPAEARCFRLSSPLREAAGKLYPVGKPQLVTSLTRGLLSVALCEVERSPDVRIPVLFDPEDEDSLRFSAVLTSVDLETAARLKGYSVRVVCALEWGRSEEVLRRGIEAQMAATRELNIPQTSNLMSRVASMPLPLESDEGVSARCSAVVRAFAASYCRSAVHSFIERVDCHFLGNFVVRHGHDRFWVRERASKCFVGVPGIQEVLPAMSR
ncbi:putative EEV maturation protein [Parapoxvirus red deer/HL953]|uniref:Putative EEV maturation protein n=1 Tax=Parapoxvirus red deer/HL953 TaxID=1579460 RepID=A0A0A7M9L9_9POXV|nr:putative EEV maturation protein [Parapoxvirus red deer/HL953]AIZ77260.1 putative EEV maturation protein [Parapoxvirus red deer/HL953]